MSRRWHLFSLASAAALLLAKAASAGDDPSDLEAALAEPIVATASQSLQDESAAPATMTNITADELRRYGIHSLDEAINYLSLGMVTQNPLHSVDIGARGVLLTADFGNHVLLLVNGHMMNEQWDGTAYFERGAAIPFELIDHIEIMLGPGSVLYGSYAMLGVINVITKRAKDYQGLHLIFESELPVSVRPAVGFGYELPLLGKTAEITGQLEYYAQSGPSIRFAPEDYGADQTTGQPRNFGPRTPPGVWGGTVSHEYYTRIPVGYVRVFWGDFELNARAATYKRATPYANEFNIAGDFDDANTWELDRWVNLDLKHRLALTSNVALRSRLYADSYDYTEQQIMSSPQDCPAGQVNGCRFVNLGISRWLGLEEQLSADWFHDGKLTTLVGADGRVRYVGAQGDFYDAVTGHDPGSVAAYARYEKAIGVYAQQTWRPLSWLDLNAGLRLDADERFGGSPKLSPRAAAAVSTWRGGTLRGIFSQAFRSPTSYEVGYTDGLTQIAAPTLGPESVTSVEASIEHRFGANRVFFGAFESSWRGMVSLQTIGPDDPALQAAVASGALPPGTTSALQYRNVDRIDDWGFNAAFEGAALERALRYGMNLTGAHARRTNSDGSQSLLTVAPQVFGNVRVSYDLPGDWPVLALTALAAGRRPADRAFDGGFTPAPYAPPQWELRGTISGPVPAVRGLSYRVSADYAFASVNPYVAGPVQQALPTAPGAQLAPVNQFLSTIGVQYDLR